MLVAAVITIRRAPDMSPKGKRDVANWMRDQADKLEIDGDLYSGVHTARYMHLNATQRKKGSKNHVR